VPGPRQLQCQAPGRHHQWHAVAARPLPKNFLTEAVKFFLSLTLLTVPNTLHLKQRSPGVKYEPYEVRDAAQNLKNNKSDSFFKFFFLLIFFFFFFFFFKCVVVLVVKKLY
jgi:hypothetical protein